MRKITISKLCLALFLSLFLIINARAQNNIAPSATVTATGSGNPGCMSGPCSTFNDLNLGTCGTQQVWISTFWPPSTTPGDDYIQFDFPYPVSFNEIVIHHASSNTDRFLSGALIQRWDGSNWVNHSSFTNLPAACESYIPVPNMIASTFRLTSFELNGPGQLSNPNFREIEVIEAPRGMNDAFVMSIDSPSVFCAGTQDIYATIGNYGLNQMDSVDLYWEFNGVLEPVIKYKQLLDTVGGTNPHMDMVYLGTKNFPYGVSNTIKVWTSLPNGVVDTINYNDTSEVLRQAALVGSYTIDATLPAGSGNYTSFSSLASDLNAFGICGPVTVSVDSGAYSDYFNLNNVAGLSALNTLTIDGQDSSKVTLSHDGSVSHGTVTLKNMSYVTIKNMTIENTHPFMGAAVQFESTAEYNSILNSTLKVDIYAASWELNNIVFMGVSNYNRIENNHIDGGSAGLRLGDWNSVLNVNNRVINNRVTNVIEIGMEFYSQDSLEARGNDIEVYTMASPWSSGVRLAEASNTIFHQNKILARYMGLSFDNWQTPAPQTRKISIANNMIIADEYGMQMYNVDSVDVFHNSISTSSSNVWTIYSFGNPISGYDVRNNIFSSKYGKTISTDQSTTLFDEMDYNIYYTQKGGVLMNIAMTDYADLASYQAAVSLQNISSIEGDPQFYDPEQNLHVVGVLASEAGDNSVLINQDIDGDVRPLSGAVSVDIGADEYDLASCPPPYNLEAFNPGLDSISLQWKGGLSGAFQVEIVSKGNSQGTGDTLTVNATNVRTGGLTPSSGYEYYVREICGRGDSSMWWGPLEFFTANEIVYLEDFESFDIGELTNGWLSTTYADPQWVSGDYSDYGAITKDHTVGAGGKFAYMKTWNSWMPGFSDLVSPYIYVDTNQKNIEFSFWYFMNGTDMGDLNVYVDTNGVSNLITTFSGQQQLSSNDPWLEFSTFLNGYDGKMIQLRFQGSKGNGSYSEIGLDDVSVDTVPPFNVGVINLISPDEEICAGQITPIVGVRNLGSTPIDSVKIIWEINGVIMDSVMYATTIFSGDTAAVTLGNITLNSTGIYDIKIYTKEPNSSSDPFPTDDTLKIENLRTGLSGVYSINPSAPASMSNFIDFKSVTDVLEMSGICGPTTINVSSGTHFESVTLKEIDGVSPINTLVFDGMDSSTTHISHDGSVSFATWTFDGADYVTLKNLGIECTNFEGATVLFANASDHNTITNCNLLVDTTISNWALQNILISSSTSTNSWGGYSSYNTIQNNKINGGDYGVNLEGSDVHKNVGNRVENNIIDNTYYLGVLAYFQDSLEIIGNEIDMWTRMSPYANGIQVSSANNTIISGNKVYAAYNGISFYNWGGAAPSHRRKEISNNMIVMESSDMWGGTALNLQEVDSINIYHNSIRINSESNGPAIVAYAWSRPLADLDLRNNIISSANSPTMDIGAPTSAFSYMDNNNYYSEGPVLAILDGVDYYTLADIQAANSLLNINSLEGNPQFASASDLHIIGNFVDNKGDLSVAINVDIDGDVRPMSGSTMVDIGADEFDPPSCPPVLNMQAFNPLANSIILQWEGGSGTFEYEIVLKDSVQGSGISANTAFDSLLVNGLLAATEYDFYVREICGRGDTSIWWGPVSFKTLLPITDFMVDAIVSPVNQTDSCFSSAEEIQLRLINLGNVDLDFSVDTTDLFVNVSGALSQSLSLQLNDNLLNGGVALAAGDTLHLSMGTINMTARGTYDLEAILAMDEDVFTKNDTLRSTVVNNSNGGTLSANSTVCGSGNVILSTVGSAGELQWQRIVNGAFTNEVSADSTSYEVYVDSIVTFRVVACGVYFSDTITITPEVIPAMPTTVSDTAIVFCGDSGTAVLSASSSVSGTINWYEDTSATFILSTGSTYNYGLNTSVQTATTIYSDTFYVSVVDGVSGCESELAMVTGAVICTVGKNELSQTESSILIHPNPSKGVFNLIGYNVLDKTEVSIYNSNGKMIYKLDAVVNANFSEEINLAGFAKGIYFIKLQTINSTDMRKIVIQ